MFETSPTADILLTRRQLNNHHPESLGLGLALSVMIGRMIPLTLALAFLGTVACSKTPPASQFPNARTALDQMKSTYACARGISGEGKLDHMNKQGRIRGDVMLMAVDPARVRFDVISQFGVTLATLTSNNRRFSFFDMKNKAFLEGPPEPCNIARLTQVRMPAHALVRLMRGEAPLLAHDSSQATLRWDDGHYVVVLFSQHEAREEIHLEPNPADYALHYAKQRLRVKYVKVMQRDYIHFEASLSGHKDATTMPPREDELGLDPPIPPSGPACRAEIPRKIHVQVPYTRDDMRFRYEDVGLNPPLPEGVFTQPMPSGVRRQFVQCR